MKAMPIKNRPFFVPKDFEFQPDFYTEFFGNINAVFTHPVKDVTIYLEINARGNSNGKLLVLYQSDCRRPLIYGEIDSLKEALNLVKIHLKDRTFGRDFKYPPVKGEYDRFLHFSKPEKQKKPLRRKANGTYYVLTSEDRNILRSMGYPESDFEQIEEAINRSTFTLDDKTVINAYEAIDILGKYTFLSGIGRSAFHWTSSRKTADGKHTMDFDSRILFK